MSTLDNLSCPHGHPKITIELEDGWLLDVGGSIIQGPYKGQECFLCIKDDWTSCEYKKHDQNAENYT